MIDKLKNLINQFDDLSVKMSNPEIIADIKFQKTFFQKTVATNL